jgi:hypothetical protein
MSSLQRLLFITLILLTTQGRAQEHESSRLVIRPYFSYGVQDMFRNNLNNYYQNAEGKNVSGSWIQYGDFSKGGLDVGFFLNEIVGVTAGLAYCGFTWEFADKSTTSPFPSYSYQVVARQRWVQVPIGICVRSNRGAGGIYAGAGTSIWFLQNVREETTDNGVIHVSEGKLSSYRSVSYAAYSELGMTVNISKLLTAGIGAEIQYQISNNFTSDYKRGHFMMIGGKVQLMFTF